MAFVLSYNTALQVIAAFVIFLFGYLAFFVFLIICLLIATGLYESGKWIRAYAERSVSANASILYFSRVFNRWWGIGNLSPDQPGGPRE
jgi:hypothetical protein